MNKSKRPPSPERILRRQLKAFRKKFGRDPLPGDPVFFDPDKDVPTMFTEEVLEEFMMAFLKDAPAHIVYAYKKTGLVLISDQYDQYDPATVAEYEAAIDEYFELEEAGKLKKQD